MTIKPLNENGYHITTNETQYRCFNCQDFGHAADQNCCANGNAIQILRDGVKIVSPNGACNKMFYVSESLHSEPVISPLKKLLLKMSEFTYANAR